MHEAIRLKNWIGAESRAILSNLSQQTLYVLFLYEYLNLMLLIVRRNKSLQNWP